MILPLNPMLDLNGDGASLYLDINRFMPMMFVCFIQLDTLSLNYIKEKKGFKQKLKIYSLTIIVRYMRALEKID